VRQRKVAAPRQGTATLTLGLSPDLVDSLKQLSAARKSAANAGGKPKFILGIVDEAIDELATALKAGKKVGFVPTPRSSEGRTALRVSAGPHHTAQKVSEAADVKLADFVRTALSLYLRSRTREIDQEAKTSGHRSRK
jgi:molybdopterin converting factor small subunit